LTVRGRSAQLLAHHPLRGGLLALPGLQQLLGKAPQGRQISGFIDRPAHALELELLTKAEAQGVAHGRHRMETGVRSSYKLFQVCA